MDRKTTVTKYAVDRWDEGKQCWANAGKRIYAQRSEAEFAANKVQGKTRVREVPVTVKLPSVFR